MKNAVEAKSFAFAVRIVKLANHLSGNDNERTLSKQILRSGTSIGANVAEAQHAQSQADFAAKLSIALKETGETLYWLRLLHATGYLSDGGFRSLYGECTELEKLLVSIVHTLQQRKDK